MSYTGTPTNVRSLEQRIRNLEGSDGLALRRRVAMALVVVGQMLPDGAVKGGSAMALRYGRGTRFTQDLDAARIQSLARFRSDFEEALAAGWAGFSGRLAELFAEVRLEAPKLVPVVRSERALYRRLPRAAPTECAGGRHTPPASPPLRQMLTCSC